MATPARVPEDQHRKPLAAAAPPVPLAPAARHQRVRTSVSLPPRSPLLAGVSLAAVTGALWQAMNVLHPESQLTPYLLVAGLVEAALLYLVLHLLATARQRARQLRQLNSLLQVQMRSLERAERELQVKQAYTRSLIEASLDPLVTIAADGKITDVNRATEEVTGVDRTELVGSDFCNYFTEPAKARAGYQQVFAEGLVQDYALAIRHTCGRVTEVLYNASVYRDERGEVKGVFAAARDVTERKRLEEELRARQAYTRSLIEASLDPLVTIAADGRITDVNRATEEVTGIDRTELVGSDFCNYFTEPAKARAGYQQVFAEGRVQDYPLAIRQRQGRITEVLYNASVFRNQAGEVEGVFAAARDITERKHLEDSLRQRTVELENSVSELEAFSYSVSHDLRAPLRSIDGFSQILLEDYLAKVDAEGQDCLRRIRAASQHMGQLIDALLQLSRVMRGELQREPVDLSVLALSTAAMIQKADPARRVRFHVANGLQGYGDRRLLSVLLQNLLQNAWKFSARGPEPIVQFASTQKEGKTAYYVRDNGIGFDMTYVGKLFTPFQRLHTKEQFEGTGIGLATVQRIIKRHGGRVWAEGVVDKGATFYFSLD
jgi:PAS domain S-box-containing protein